MGVCYTLDGNAARYFHFNRGRNELEENVMKNVNGLIKFVEGNSHFTDELKGLLLKLFHHSDADESVSKRQTLTK